jgi:hypothetical protein
MDFNPIPFNVLFSLGQWFLMVAIVAVAGLALTLVLTIARNGFAGNRIFWAALGSYASDLLSLSPRRILAITNLTFKEAVRRKALYVFVVFAVLLMFAGWFISDSNERPELQVNVHITFVLTTIAWLILPAAIFLSCWGIPEDIRLRSMHTVVTKPVPRLEIVLGRMLGFGTVTAVVLAIMGVIGLLWIERVVPESVRHRLVCRVPVFGYLYFMDIEGRPRDEGINVGDTWKYRSYIQGNTQARAVWVFSNITANSVGDEGVRIESRFEAFRTMKGTEKSVREGIEAQFTLIQNPRDLAFSGLNPGASMQDFAESLRAGQFRSASDHLKKIAERVRTAPKDIPSQDFTELTNGLYQAIAILKNYDSKLIPFSEQLAKLQKATAEVSKVSEASGNAVYESIATECDSVSDFLKTNADDLQESLARLEVPLEPFGVAEFHEGDNVTLIPRKIRAIADSETLARFLATRVDEVNKSGKLVENDQFSDSAAAAFEEGEAISPLNAERLVTVLKEQIDGGIVQIVSDEADSSRKLLRVADGRRWFAFFDDLVRRDMLVSPDPEGWALDFDLFKDLTKDGTLRIEVACLDDQMYLGMAPGDLFVHLKERPFWVGYSKAILTTGFMLLLVVVLGVTASCIVKGPVAVLFTLTIFIVGQFFQEFLQRIVGGHEPGMGMIESAAMILQHRNPQVGMDASEATLSFVKALDFISRGLLSIASNIIPNFSVFSEASLRLEKGFDVPVDSAVLPAAATFLGFLVPCVLLAGACLKFRELESK